MALDNTRLVILQTSTHTHTHTHTLAILNDGCSPALFIDHDITVGLLDTTYIKNSDIQ